MVQEKSKQAIDSQKCRTALVLLAAGDSRRFKGNKLLSLFEGKTMYRHIVDQAETLPGLFFRKIIVTQYPEIGEDLEKLGYEVVENHESILGISHSIQLALAALGDTADAACFAVCDQPWLTAKTIEGLIDGWKRSGRGLGCLAHNGELGNPSVFSSPYFTELAALTGDRGGKRILRSHLEDVYLFEVENEQELRDIDTRGMPEVIE